MNINNWIVFLTSQLSLSLSLSIYIYIYIYIYMYILCLIFRLSTSLAENPETSTDGFLMGHSWVWS